MSYRRRRGLGSGGSWLDRLLGREGDASGGEASGGEPTGGGSSAPGFRGGDSVRRIGVGLLILAALFGGGYLVASQWLFPATSAAESSELVEIPDLVGLTAEEAREALGSADLEYRLGSEVPHRRAPEGAVLAQSPLPGQFARPGAPVSVTLSLGPERRVVPDLRGLSDRQGAIVLERLGFRTSQETTSSAVEGGRVVGTRPETGTELTLPADVTIIVSRGPNVAQVPDLVGLHVEDVEGRLEEAGLVLGEVQYDPEASAAPGRVVGQSPNPDFSLRAGGRVSIRVAGPRPGPRGEVSPDTADARGVETVLAPVDASRASRQRG